MERYLKEHAQIDEPKTYYLLKSITAIGDILAITLLYEIHTITRFPTVADFTSYCQLAPNQHTSAGKRAGPGGRKMGNAHLKWAFGQAASLMMRNGHIKDRMEKTSSDMVNRVP